MEEYPQWFKDTKTAIDAIINILNVVIHVCISHFLYHNSESLNIILKPYVVEQHTDLPGLFFVITVICLTLVIKNFMKFLVNFNKLIN